RCRAELDTPAVVGVDVSEAVEQTGAHQVHRNLSGRVEIVAAEQDAEAEFLAVAKTAGVIAVQVVEAVTVGALERPIRVGALVGQVSVHALRVGAEGQKSAAGIEIAALQAQSKLIGQ